ncbi:hypothetical protein HYY69_01920 [Candidatus Woesearchaeota archaeon]|nr:hypothetical protein [Candidatus Woesearchaeota archaeon]
MPPFQEDYNKNYEFILKREYSFLYGYSAVVGEARLLKQELGKEDAVRADGKDGWISLYREKGAQKKLNKKLYHDLKKDPLLMNVIINELEEKGSHFIAVVNNMVISEQTSVEQLKSYYKDYYNGLINFCVILWKSFYLVDIMAIIFKEALEQELPPEKVEDAIKHYSHPSEKAVLLRIADYFKKEHDTNKRIEYVKEHAPWIGNTDPFVKPLDSTQIREYVLSFKINNNEQYENHPDFHVKNKEIIKVYQKFLYIKDKRDEYRREAFYLGQKLVTQLAKRLHLVNDKDLGYLLPEETMLSKKQIDAIIEKRKEAFIVEMHGETITTQQGKEILNNFIEKQLTEQIHEIKGIVGSKGKTIGKVQVITKREDLQRFEEGNILVAVTTNPEYIVAMQKASAFITDEGGITCHAAIVAREMNKPCIVGTKIATKVFKNNDMIEVDGEKGIIRKI